MKQLVLLVFLTCILPVSAQTQVASSQIKVGVSTSTTNTFVLGYTLGGSFRPLELGPGLKLESFGAGIRLVIDMGLLKVSVRNETKELVRDSNGSYSGADPSCAITRNGLTLTPGKDYTFSGNLVVPNPAYPWFAGDAENRADMGAAVCPVVTIG